MKRATRPLVQGLAAACCALLVFAPGQLKSASLTDPAAINARALESARETRAKFLAEGEWDPMMKALSVATSVPVAELSAAQCSAQAEKLHAARTDYPISPLLTEIAMRCAGLLEQDEQADAYAEQLAAQYQVIFDHGAGLSPLQPARLMFEVELDPLERALDLSVAHLAHEVDPERGSLRYRIALLSAEPAQETWIYSDVLREWTLMADKEPNAYVRISYALDNAKGNERQMDALARWQLGLARGERTAQHLHQKLRAADDTEAARVMARLCAARGWQQSCAQDAVDALVELVEVDDGEALVWMAVAYALGRGAAQDESAALLLLKRAGQRVRFAASWAFFARQLRPLSERFASHASYREAVRIASDAGLPEAIALAAELERQDGKSDAAITRLERAAKLHPSLRLALAELQASNGQSTQASGNLRQAAEDGWPAAQLQRATSLFQEPTPKAKADALALLNRAALGGSAAAMLALAEHIWNLEGTEASREEAVAQAWAAARLGSDTARRSAAIWCRYFSELKQCRGPLRQRLLRRLHQAGDKLASLEYFSLQLAAADAKARPDLIKRLEVLADALPQAWLKLGTDPGSNLDRRVGFLQKAREKQIADADLELSVIYWEQGRDRDALALLEGVQQKTPTTQNNHAWFLCAYPKRSAHAPKRGLALAESAVRDLEIAPFIDTLATCEAASGQFDRALASATRAWLIASRSGLSGVQLQYFDARIKLFRDRNTTDEDALAQPAQ